MTRRIAFPVTSLEPTDQIPVVRPNVDENRYITAADMIDNLYTTVGAASATEEGVVELATNAEAITGTDAARAVTPAALAAATTTHVAAASATVAGKIEIATDAEAKTGTDTTRAVTAANARAVLTGIKLMSFTGRDGAGACTAVGAVAGDKVLYVAGLTTSALGNASASFEATITVNDEIQQSSVSDLSTNEYMAALLAVA